MAASQAAGLVEKVIGHGDNAAVTTDVSNLDRRRVPESRRQPGKEKTTSKLVGSPGLWAVYYFSLTSTALPTVEMPKPRVIDESDVIVKVTGSTICGSDLHLYHGMICGHHNRNTLWERRALLNPMS
jgi:hypothetical protein